MKTINIHINSINSWRRNSIHGKGTGMLKNSEGLM